MFSCPPQSYTSFSFHWLISTFLFGFCIYNLKTTSETYPVLQLSKLYPLDLDHAFIQTLYEHLMYVPATMYTLDLGIENQETKALGETYNEPTGN